MRIILCALCAIGCVATVDGPSPNGYTETDWTPYEELPIKETFQWTSDRFDGKALRYYMPEEPTAVLWAFHGTNGGFGTVTQIEWIELYNRLVPYGVGIILTESEDRVVQQWDLTSNPNQNVDFVKLQGVRDYLVSTTGLSESTPMLAVGFSNGGNFAPVFSSMAKRVGWDIRGFSVHSAGDYGGDGIPGIYTSAEWDETVDAEQVARAAENCSEATGTECPLLVGTEIPMDPRRFARLALYSLRTSQDIFDELVEMEYIDADGNRLATGLPGDIDELMNTYIAKTKMPSPTMPPTQIRVVWSTHRFSSQHVNEEVEYLLSLF